MKIYQALIIAVLVFGWAWHDAAKHMAPAYGVTYFDAFLAIGYGVWIATILGVVFWSLLG